MIPGRHRLSSGRASTAVTVTEARRYHSTGRRSTLHRAVPPVILQAMTSGWPHAPKWSGRVNLFSEPPLGARSWIADGFRNNNNINGFNGASTWRDSEEKSLAVRLVAFKRSRGSLNPTLTWEGAMYSRRHQKLIDKISAPGGVPRRWSKSDIWYPHSGAAYDPVAATRLLGLLTGYAPLTAPCRGDGARA